MAGWWAISHREPRRRLYVPEVRADDSLHTPNVKRLSRRRWTYLTPAAGFGGRASSSSDRPPEGPSEALTEEYEVSDRGEDTEMPYWWVGTTYFREVHDGDHDPVDDWSEWQPKIVKGMLRGVGSPGHPALVTNLSAAGVERQLLINAQIDCHQFGGVYAACLAASREQDELAAVRAYALQHPEHMSGILMAS